MIVDLADLSPTEDHAKAAAALERYTLRLATTAEDFALGHGVIDGVFGPTGEIERVETLRAWFDAGSLSAADAPITAWYHLVLCFDGAELAGVRDCFVTVDAANRRAVVLLSHSYVFEPHRRSGLAALIRTVPATLARRALGPNLSPLATGNPSAEPGSPRRAPDPADRCTSSAEAPMFTEALVCARSGVAATSGLARGSACAAAVRTSSATVIRARCSGDSPWSPPSNAASLSASVSPV